MVTNTLKYLRRTRNVFLVHEEDELVVYGYLTTVFNKILKIKILG
jgi:hypothetical protein